MDASEGINIAVILTSIREGESISISYDAGMEAIVIGASKEMWDETYRKEIRIYEPQIAILQPEYREIYIGNTIKAVLGAVRDTAR